MVLVVDILPLLEDGVRAQGTVPSCAPETPHMILGTLRERVDENEVETLLRRWRDSDSFQGRIWSIGLSGKFELAGDSRPVLRPLVLSPMEPLLGMYFDNFRQLRGY